MLPNDLSVRVSGETHGMSLSSLAENRSVRSWLDSDNLSLPMTLTVSRNVSGKGAKAVDSYLIRLDQTIATQVDASNNVQGTQTLSAYLVVKVPRGAAMSAVRANGLGSAVCTLAGSTVSGIASTILERVLQGEL